MADYFDFIVKCIISLFQNVFFKSTSQINIGELIMKVDFYKHNLSEIEINEVSKVLNSIFLTTGPLTKQFEDSFSKFLGVSHTIGVTSCTAALFLSLKALGIGDGDEVITTPMTFIATPNTILHAGAKPVFVDVEPETGNINVELIEKSISKKTKAIIPVHLYGQMCDMKKLHQIAKDHDLFIIEDSAHCIEGSRDGIKPGQLGDLACFSFYATKNMTSGEGGAIATNSQESDDILRKMRLHGMSKSSIDRYTSLYHHWDMELLGYKYNMFDIQAALLLNQLKMIEERLQRKEEICQKYMKAFSKMDGIDFPKTLPNSKHARHLFTVWVKPGQRDHILHELQKAGIGVAVNFRAVHLLTYYQKTFDYQRGNFPFAENIGDRTISIPMYPKMTDEEIDYVISQVKKIVT